MKGYVVLLAVLYAAMAFVSGVRLLHPLHFWTVARDLATMVAFSLCLVGAFGLAWGRTWWTPRHWVMAGQATLILGGLAVILFGYGELFGVPTPQGRPGLLHMGMVFLPYLLFAIPVILYGSSQEKAGE
ncbi:MAG: hypothetical protein EOM25_12720 [Deltaproteobacteria bacterium]|nr:hypothetical protein [Deltaproteobacteria bacterium]